MYLLSVEAAHSLLHNGVFFFLKDTGLPKRVYLSISGCAGPSPLHRRLSGCAERGCAPVSVTGFLTVGASLGCRSGVWSEQAPAVEAPRL